MKPASKGTPRALLLLLPLACAAACPPPATAGDPAAAAPAPAIVAAPTVTPTAPPSAPAGGMIVARDPETGALTVPSPEQRRELLPEEFGAALLTSQPLFETAAPGGGYMIRLDGLLMDYVVVTRGPDGKPVLTCVHDANAAAALAAGGAAAPAVSPEPEEE